MDPSSLAPPTHLAFRKRRWTAVFALPFALVVGISGLSSFFVLRPLIEGPLGAAISLLATFTCLCIAGSVGKASLDSLASTGPSLIVDKEGLTDLVRKVGPVPWHHMERVELDACEDRIVIVLGTKSNAVATRGLLATASRLFRGGDIVFSLKGLSYCPQQLERSLKGFHSQAIARR